MEITSIDIGKGNLSNIKNIQIVKSANSVTIITDENVAKHWLNPLLITLSDSKTKVIQIKSGEQNKSIRTLEMIWKEMLAGGADRSSVVVTLGGGVVCDIGGFAAATYMRGIPVVHIPTTLLAQVDASIGGKTAIDFMGIKNSIGIFHQPSAVIIDVDTLKTLPHRQIISGMAEVIKHAIIADRKLFTILLKMKVDTLRSEDWIKIISRSVAIKQKIVDRDIQEKNGIRKQLNFGHTVGHAIEALSLKTNNSLLHGEAVALGMVAEANMSRTVDERLIVSLIFHWGLPLSISGMSLSQINSVIQTDKKNRAGKILWSLPRKIGSIQTDVQLEQELVSKGILSIIS